MTNTPMTNLTQTEEEEKEKEHNETNIVRNSVTELLQDKIIPGEDFIQFL